MSGGNQVGKEPIKKADQSAAQSAIKNSDPKRDSYDPWENRQTEKPISNVEVVLHIWNVTMGAGQFSLPISFQRAGLIPGLFSAVFVALVSIYCTIILIQTQYKVAKRNMIPYADYGFTMRDCLSNGPKYCQKISKFGEILADVSLILYTMGTTTVYIIFIAVTLIDALKIDMSPRLMATIVTACLVPVVLMPNWKILAVASVAGTVFMLSSLGFLHYFIFRPDDEGYRGYDEMKLGGLWTGSAFMMGTMLLGMQNINVVIAVDEVMKTPRLLIGRYYLGLFPVNMVIILAFYLFTGISGYMKYGSESKSSVTHNLPGDETLAIVVELVFIACIVCTFPVFLTFLSGVIHNKYMEKMSHTFKKNLNIFTEMLVRVLALFVCLGVAVIIPKIDILTALMGSLTITLCALFYPALLDYLYRWSVSPENKLTPLMVIDIVIMIYSPIMLVVTTYSAINAYLEGNGS